ncbi:ABC transporter permease [Brenneria tiliae]|uniref:ABC transporter permease n=1 Tax=Brenneria tiliae TaxID=2914984 RepID=A0ABT0MTM6_9GAMM|nr:ABC transporter permease [Brenneria tiliae]MCL2893189.1 ABC transporter permease [Brenneria tiliae]MCL2898228.1 ABC transporter permease [Brenneria tiliae]MCL2902578.1 ABC transporter permease [Brenneria tiliae]
MTRRRIAAGRVAWHALIALIYLFLLAPIIVVLIISFDTRQYLSFPPESFSWGSYRKVIDNAEFIAAFWRSLVIGVTVGTIAVIAGILLALAITRYRFRGRRLISFLVAAPFLVPHIVLAVGLMLVLAPLGLLDSYGGIILAHLGITIPYTVRTISMSLLAVDPRLEEAALIHGARPFRVFRCITLPLIRPGLIAGAVIAFLISFDEATLSLFIVSTHTSTLPTEIYRYLEYSTDPQIAALSVMLILISVLVVVILERLVGLRKAL